MLLAAGIGALAAAALALGAVVAYVVRPTPRLVAVVMAAGSGLLIGSVAYDLVEDANLTVSTPLVGGSMLAGAAAFVLGSRSIERFGGRRRKRPTRGAAEDDATTTRDQPFALVLGSTLDGVPESLVLGMSVLHGVVSIPLLVGIALANLPEGMAASSGLRARGWSLARTLGLWAVVIAASAAASAFGHEISSTDDTTWMGVAQTFAAGALLAMIADTMVPEAYEVERWWTGLLVVAGFTGSLVLAAVLG